MIILTILVSVFLLLLPQIISGQFPAVCNKPENLQTKTCCPNNCGSPTRGTCKNISEEVKNQWKLGDPNITNILLDAPNQQEKGTADARYLWPTVVFDNVCVCNDNFGGFDCNECDFGWTGSTCNTKKTPVVRKSFSRLTQEERQIVVNTTRDLKNEMGYWSVIIEEPTSYTSGTVTLQNVSTYNYFVYLHNYVARDQECMEIVNNDITVDFAHVGPVFPVWHRRYILTVEKEFQRILNNDSFGLPYWQWEENDMTPFAEEYYGIPANKYGTNVSVSGSVINPDQWNTICDITYWKNDDATCSDGWRPCNPAEDLAEHRPLMRGDTSDSAYLPNRDEVMIAIAAPSYDAPNKKLKYSDNNPRTSFRSRLEGWNIICSAVVCTGPKDTERQHMHNNVHNWVGGQMDEVPAAINDPIFNLHHCNVDRIFESWLQRFAATGTCNSSDTETIPPYVPVSGGHPGHNRDDYIVPFFPLIKAGTQYQVAEEWGYKYDELIPADIADSSIPNCSSVILVGSCPTCDANSTCIDCTNQTCPSVSPVHTQPGDISEGGSELDLELSLGLGLGLGLPFLAICILSVVATCYTLVSKSQKKSGREDPSKQSNIDIKTKT